MMKTKLIIILGLMLFLISGCQVSIPSFFGNQSNTSSEDQNSDFFMDLIYNNSDNLENITGEDDISDENADDSTQEERADDTLPLKIIKEGETVRFNKDVAFDPDGDTLTYTFTEPLNDEGIWKTELGDAGEYISTITVSDGKLTSSQKVKIIVEAVNNKPQISNFNDVEVNEGETISFDPEVFDEDGDEVELSYSGFMTSSTYETDFNDAGTYEVILTADDGKQQTQKSVEVRVNDVNRKPVITQLDDDITVTEGDSAIINYDVSDPDGDAISVSFSEPFDNEGVWETKKGDAGTYDIELIASDGIAETVETITVVVKSLNNLPQIIVPEVIEVEEGDLIEINADISDPDGDEVKVTYSGFMTSSTYQTTFDDAGNYSVIIEVDDGQEVVRKEIEIVINDKNRPPQFIEGAFA